MAVTVINRFRAFAWLRWRLMVNGLRGGQRRDRLEQISRALAFAGPFLLVAMAAGSVVISAAAALMAGTALSAGELSVGAFARIATGILTMAFVVTAGFAVASPVKGGSDHAPRLLLLPISSWMLHLVEVAARLVDPWIGLLVPPLLGLSIGLLMAGAPAVAAVAFVAGVVVVGTQASLSSVIGQLAGWVVRSRRRGEAFALLIPLTLALVSFVPAAVRVTSRDRAEPARTEQARPAGGPRTRPDLPVAVRAMPPYAYAQAVSATLASGPRSGLPWLVLLIGEGALLFLLSSAIHARLGTASADRGRSSRRAWPRPVTLFWLGPSASAVAYAHVRTVLRSVQGRMAVLFPGPVIAAVTAVALRSENASVITATALDRGYLVFGVAALFALYSLQNVILNVFGSDRAGLTLQFLLPVSDRELARGKVAGGLMVFGIALGLALIATVVVAPTGAMTLWLSTLLGAVAVSLLVVPVALWLSTIFPVRSDLSKLSRAAGGSRPHVVSTLVGLLSVPVGAAVPAALLVAVPALGGSPLLSAALMVGWILLVMLVARLLTDRAAPLIRLRRETLALVAQGR